MRDVVPARSSADPAGEFPFEPATYFFHLAVAITHHRDALLNKMLEPFGRDLASFRALQAIHKFQSCTMGELADYTVTDRTTLTRIIDHLVRDELVIRATPTGDRRKVVLSLTAAGRRLNQKARTLALHENARLVADLPDADLREAIRLQQRVAGGLIEDRELLDRVLLAGETIVRADPKAGRAPKSKPAVAGAPKPRAKAATLKR